MTRLTDPWADAGPAPARPRPGSVPGAAQSQWSTAAELRADVARAQDDPLAGFEPVSDRTARRYARRPALSLWTRSARALGNLFRHDPTPERMAAHARAVQAPVTTGRRIAVVSLRGGAGKTTVSALMARTFSALRPEPVAAVDLDPGLGSLGLRLGGTTLSVPAPGADRLAAELAAMTTTTLEAVTSRMAVSGEDLFHTGPRVAGRPLGNAAATTLLSGLSRYFPVTVLDCPTGPDSPDTAAALARSHAAVFVVPATPAGVDEATGYLRHWLDDPFLSSVPVAAAVVATDADGILDPLAQAAALSRVGVLSVALRHDRHLATGVGVSLPLARPENRMAVAELSGRVLGLANDAPGGHR
ncbi:MAG: ParA family protein [Micrococcus sp.]|nr:ParA family protein [Micrococcus sp.]